jgi:hypothetical protein
MLSTLVLALTMSAAPFIQSAPPTANPITPQQRIADSRWGQAMYFDIIADGKAIRKLPATTPNLAKINSDFQALLNAFKRFNDPRIVDPNKKADVSAAKRVVDTDLAQVFSLDGTINGAKK